ncbi:hypothetical protein IHV12_19660 [Fictibacillus sp. 7GRE50]|jgi:hypothetical protein|uniref:hypothetical protein n=1 Tax=Fictibacillus sp. 7GRE50 TaxID=2745878 RepID=UPI0018CD5827|nr:hypothetical protein [Fictibacillus sp. 7GRE50]MBH0167145.1 hypothetical protein [Fictibacillus sp. 7GRE50]
MKDFPFVIFIIYIGFMMILLVAHYKTEEYRHRATLTTMTESAEIAGVKSLDNSARVEIGRAELTESKFEASFQDLFETNANAKINPKDFDFQYLKSEDGKIKAVRIKITDDRNNAFKTTYVADVNK